MYQQQKRYNTAILQRLQSCHGFEIKAKWDWCGVGRPHVAIDSQLPRFLVVDEKLRLMMMMMMMIMLADYNNNGDDVFCRGCGLHHTLEEPRCASMNIKRSEKTRVCVQ